MYHGLQKRGAPGETPTDGNQPTCMLAAPARRAANCSSTRSSAILSMTIWFATSLNLLKLICMQSSMRLEGACQRLAKAVLKATSRLW